NYRSDTGAVLATVSDGYQVIQNHEAFSILDRAIGEAGAWWETGGCLKAGRRVFLCARLPQSYRAGKDDDVRPYVLTATSHDGRLALLVGCTTTRVVCENTLNLALSESWDFYRVYHTKGAAIRLEDVRQSLGLVTDRFATFQDELNALAGRYLTGMEI